MAGKGDKPRPFVIPREEFERKWDKINWKKTDKQTRNKSNEKH